MFYAAFFQAMLAEQEGGVTVGMTSKKHGRVWRPHFWPARAIG
jgi:hypothetical protein